jgi:hypothetical protein
MTAPAVPATPPPYNRIGINFRAVPPRKVTPPGGIIDAHAHCFNVTNTGKMFEAAAAYGIGLTFSMGPLEEVDALNAAFPGRLKFIAIPKWQSAAATEEFTTDWLKRLDAFYEKGARLFKIHMAPGTKKRWGMTFDHPIIQTVIKRAYGLGYNFMTHVCDPKAWFSPPGKYANPADGFGTFEEQFTPLEALLEKFPDRLHLGAHMGGCLEDLPLLAKRLDRFPQYVIDTSATKWILRAVAQQNAAAVRDFVIAYQDRILFGSDLVTGDAHDFDHYASRYWSHQMQWETNYNGPSPIDDPDAAKDAEGVPDPQIHGLDLPADVLQKLYRTNAERLLLSL